MGNQKNKKLNLLNWEINHSETEHEKAKNYNFLSCLTLQHFLSLDLHIKI